MKNFLAGFVPKQVAKNLVMLNKSKVCLSIFKCKGSMFLYFNVQICVVKIFSLSKRIAILLMISKGIIINDYISLNVLEKSRK